jgi:hypothetical protein
MVPDSASTLHVFAVTRPTPRLHCIVLRSLIVDDAQESSTAPSLDHSSQNKLQKTSLKRENDIEKYLQLQKPKPSLGNYANSAAIVGLGFHRQPCKLKLGYDWMVMKLPPKRRADWRCPTPI